MDSLTVMITGFINHQVSSTNFILFLIGFVVPILTGMILTRRKTIGYGRLIYKVFGTVLAQKRVHVIPSNILQTLLTLVRSTFVDMAFGVYIESRQDITKEDKEKKTQEYLDSTTEQNGTKEEPKDKE